MSKKTCPKYIRDIEDKVMKQLKYVKKPSSELYESQQLHGDQVLEIFRRAFKDIIDSSVTYSNILNEVKNAYESALDIRDKRISQFIIQDKVFGITKRKQENEDKVKMLVKHNEDLREQNMRLNFEISKLQKDLGLAKTSTFPEHLALMRERDARYTLFFENLQLQMKVKQLDGSAQPDQHGDPVILRIALDRCREQLTETQGKLVKMTEEYAETVPRQEYEALSCSLQETTEALETLKAEHLAVQDTYKRIVASKKSMEEELSETRERCRELERAGTPRPQWELCADFIGGGRDRWQQLSSGRSSRDTLRVLLKELGPAAESDHLEYFDGLGTDPMIPAYLRYEGRVRNLRLSRREVSVIVNDIWLGKAQHRDMPMQDYVTMYFEDRYQQSSVRAEWAYNLCAGAEQMLDEPGVRLVWGALHASLSEHVYWGLHHQWTALKEHCYKQAKDNETITMDEFEKVVRSVFPLKSEVDVKSLSDVARKQVKLKLNQNELNLDKLFHENEEGFLRIELSRELYRQRQAAQDKYIREVMAVLGGRRATAAKDAVTVDALKRAFAIVDPAIDHKRMERYIRWAFSIPASSACAAGAVPARALAARLAQGDIERVGHRNTNRTAHNIA